MARRDLLFRSQATAWIVGAALVIAGAYCFHDAFGKRGSSPPWLLRTVTPGM